MNDVTRGEFDRLVERVTRVEQTLGATVEIAASELVGLRTYLDERFDHQDRMLDALASEVQAEFDTHADILTAHGRTLVEHGHKLDEHGRTLTGRAVTFASRDAGVASVTAAGVVSVVADVVIGATK